MFIFGGSNLTPEECAWSWLNICEKYDLCCVYCNTFLIYSTNNVGPNLNIYKKTSNVSSVYCVGQNWGDCPFGSSKDPRGDPSLFITQRIRPSAKHP